jgi:hypothetical protein
LLLIETGAWGTNLNRQIKFHSSTVSSSMFTVFATLGAKASVEEIISKQEEKEKEIVYVASS